MLERFTVDTHVFRELGQLLVGRDSTALVELIKNSYDADATTITVHGRGLADPSMGYILVTDNGSGMTEPVFREGFLRIASRLREIGDRRSKSFRRRFTGAKGIGRLAAHKLARVIEVSSVALDEEIEVLRSLDARIDWDRIERSETLDTTEEGAIVVSTCDAPAKAITGTAIRLSKLRSPWRPEEKGRFLAEVQGFSPPTVLIEALPGSVLEKPLLFRTPVTRESGTKDPGFRLALEGEFAIGEEYWQAMAEASSWVVEISARTDGVDFGVAPTRRTCRDNPHARRETFSIEHPSPTSGPFFDARILVREGPLQGFGREQRGWAGRIYGVRVFMEGFRVLPYGEPGDDWLSLDAAYTARARSLDLLATEFWEKAFAQTADDPDRDLGVLANKQYFGSVFLTQANAPELRMVVNREGFIPDRGFHILRDLVRTGIDVSTRVRAAASYHNRVERRTERAAPRTKSQVVLHDIPGKTRIVQEARSLAGNQRWDAAYKKMSEAIDDDLMGWLNDSSEQIAMLRITASVGTQMAAFVHELNGLLGMAQAVEQAVERLRLRPDLPRAVSSPLAQVARAVGDLRRGIERQASYLIDVVSPDARRRRSRQSLAERFSAATRLVEVIAVKRGIMIENNIPIDLKSPAMFPAELTTVFSNLLTNAVKAAGHNGRIRAQGVVNKDGAIAITVENTGKAIDLEHAERWFQPFESTTTKIDPVLGQGMGLGLPITRSMLDQYGAEIRFVPPSPKFATAVQITFQGR